MLFSSGACSTVVMHILLCTHDAVYALHHVIMRDGAMMHFPQCSDRMLVLP